MISLKKEDLYSRIFFSAVVAIGVTDADGKYIIVNPTWCELLGYSAEEAMQLHVNDVTPEDDWDSSLISFEYLMSCKDRNLRKKRRYKRKDGSHFWADLHVSTLYDAQDKAIGLLGVFVNIDQQVKAEETQRNLLINLESLNTELSQVNTSLRHLARHDALTGLFNRRVLEEVLEKESNRYSRTKRGYGVAIADIDNFKQVNDTHGHDCGDLVLKELSQIFLDLIRNTDTVGRWGGEEFLFIFPETSCQGAMVVIERIRKQVEKSLLMYGGREISPTITIGLSYHSGDQSIDEIINEADKALYRGKKSGKNRVVCYQDVCTEEIDQEAEQR